MRIHLRDVGASALASEPGPGTAAKLGRVATTLAPALQSCPRDCALWDECFYRKGLHLGRVNRELEAASAGASPEGVASAEAVAVDLLRGDAPLRLHVGGDARTRAAARRVAAAARRYAERGGQPVFTYTHAWRRVRRGDWAGVSVLASVETLAEAGRAMALGYAAAITVDRHPPDGRAWKADDLRIVPCVEQTRGVKCDECRLCFDDLALLRRRAVIAFAKHGPAHAPRRRRLVRIRGRRLHPAAWARLSGNSVDLIRARRRRRWSWERAVFEPKQPPGRRRRKR